MCTGGGSSGSSGGNDALWNTQAQKINQDMAMSGELFDYWKKYSPGYLANANAMTQEAMDGTLTNRMRSTAGADADQATAQGLASANRSLDRYGATLNPNAMAHDSKSIALQGAANKAGLMSKATQWGEGQKWARNQDAYGLSSGMPGNAVGMSNSAQMGLNGLSSQQNSANATAGANAAGYGTMGATLASGLFNSKADGGMIKVNGLASGGMLNRLSEYGPGQATMEAIGKDTSDLSTTQQVASIAGDPVLTMLLKNGGAVRKPNGLAMGGVPSSPVMGWRDRMATMPTISQQNNSSNPASNMLGGALPKVATEVAKPYLKEGLSAVKNAIMPAATEASGITGGSIATGLSDVAGTSAATGLGAEVGAGGANLAAGTLNTGLSAANTGLAAAGTTAAEVGAGGAASLGAGAAATGTAAAAGTGAAASGAAAAGLAAVPVAGWIAGAALLASQLFNKKADGGSMDRVDMLQGGAVSGKGTETSDSIPAWLSDKEYVLNAEAVKMIGKKKLDKMNEKGLKHRHGSQARMVDGEAKPNGLAGGGMLGIAMGAGAETYNRLEQQKERTRIADQEMAIRQQQADQQAVDSGMRQKEHGLKMESDQITLDQQRGVDAHLKETEAGIVRLRSGDMGPMGDIYNQEVPDGHTVRFTNGPNGQIGNLFDSSGKLVKEFNIGKPEIEKAVDQYTKIQREKLRFTSPAFYSLLEKTEAEAANQKLKADANALDRQYDRETKLAVVDRQIAGRVGRGGGGGGGSSDPSKGAKFDTDGDGNRVIVYRDGSMVYPKDSSGAPIKFRAGTDQDTKFVRGLVTVAERNRIPDMNENPVERAKQLAEETKKKPAPSASQSNPAKPWERYKQPSP